jgi:phosphatidylglycerophosphatase A
MNGIRPESSPASSPDSPAGSSLGPRHPAWLIATCFGVGFLPKAPGTWGSLAAVPFAYGIHHWFGAWGLAVAAGAIFLAGLWAAGEFKRHSGQEDPQAVVVDEVAGQWLALVPAGDDILLYAAGFFLFRLFDIWKPWPVSWADRELGGGLGVMLDDVIAGAYAGGLVWAAAAFLRHG